MIEIINNKVILDNEYEIREYYTDKGIVRALVSDECIQSLIYKDNPKILANDYFLYYDLPIELNPNGKDYLVLGGGAFCYPQYFINKYIDKYMDVVEISEICIEYAKKYFYLDDLITNNRFNLIVDDANKYISNCLKKYDYILIDLFNGRIPNKDIYSENNLKYLKNILNEKGVIVVNYIISKENIDFKEDINKITKIFNNYKIISSQVFHNQPCNIIMILSDSDINISNNYKYYDVTF